MSNPKANDHIEYCAQQALAHDRERMLCAMMAPQPARAGLVALLAWNLEIARVGEVASEEMIGLIRFQWWRDALEEIYAGKPLRQHAVVLSLAETIRKYDLPQEPFLEIIATREADLERAPFRSFEALDAYACTTGGTLQKLWLRVLEVTNHHAEEAAEHVGAAWALIGSLRASHHLAHDGKLRLPTDELAAQGLTVDTILQEGFSGPVSDVVQMVAELAAEHIRDARALHQDIPKEALPALYLAIQGEDYLHRLKASGYDPARPAMAKGRAKRALQLWWASVIKKY